MGVVWVVLLTQIMKDMEMDIIFNCVYVYAVDDEDDDNDRSVTEIECKHVNS